MKFILYSMCAFMLMACQQQEAALEIPHHSINYIELSTPDIEATKTFYHAAFGWEFQDWGPDYVSFTGAVVNGGFAKVDTSAVEGGPLIILYSANLEQSEEDVTKAGGVITVPTFSYPGGRRFHFKDPVGNVLAIWSEDPSAE